MALSVVPEERERDVRSCAYRIEHKCSVGGGAGSRAHRCSNIMTMALYFAAFLMMSVEVASHAGLAGPSPPSIRNTGPLLWSQKVSLTKYRCSHVRLSPEKWSSFCVLNHCGCGTVAPGGSGGGRRALVLQRRGAALVKESRKPRTSTTRSIADLVCACSKRLPSRNNYPEREWLAWSSVARSLPQTPASGPSRSSANELILLRFLSARCRPIWRPKSLKRYVSK